MGQLNSHRDHPPARHVLVVSDPGPTSRRMSLIDDALARELETAFGVPVIVSTRTALVRLTPDYELEVSAARRLAEEYDHVDMTVLLTEVPRHTRGQPLIAEAFPDSSIAVVSCPTLGAWSAKKRMTKALVGAFQCMESASGAATPMPPGFKRSTPGKESESYTLHSSTLMGGPRLVSGMVLANEPWKAVPALSSALAAATATGAFGVFYSSIWQMADYLHPARLAVIALLAMVTMVVWLMFSNGLWDTPRRASLASVVMFYNFSTLLTLFVAVISLYSILFVFVSGSAAIVIDSEFMSEILGKQATIRNYLNIGWLSASMGLVAGALGSSFDSHADLRRLTHGQRERQRQYTED